MAVLTQLPQPDASASSSSRAVQEFFDENKATLHGAVTYPTSAKHLALYHKFGYKPKGLTAVMSRALDRSRRPPRRAQAAAQGPGSRVRRFSTLEETKKKAALARLHRITNAVCRGLDSAKEIEIVDGLALGDTLLLERGNDLVGFAIYHAPGRQRGARGRALREVPGHRPAPQARSSTWSSS